MGRIRLNKKDRAKAAPGGTNQAIYVWGKRKEKWVRINDEKDKARQRGRG